MKSVAIGGKNWTFAVSEGGGKAMAIAYTLIETAKLSAVDPQAWLAWALERIADHEITKLDALFPWHYGVDVALAYQLPHDRAGSTGGPDAEIF